jgi:hypothetical protein
MNVIGHLYAPTILPWGKRSCCLLNWRLDGPYSRYGYCGDQKYLLTLP